MGDGSTHTVLLTGATGYLGGLVASTLLANECSRVVAPIRRGHTRESLIEKIKWELESENLADEIDFSRLSTIALPPIDQLEDMLSEVANLSVQEIIHCAGSVDYFDTARLKEANIDMTAKLIWLGKELSVSRFTYVSTAFSCGFSSGLVRETLHTAPDCDPTEYTRSKRDAEALVAEAGLPFLIIRPSVVIGDSRDGRYAGKAYGLYQYWKAFEKFLGDRYRDELHYVAPQNKLQVLHQDAFNASFLAAYRQLPNDSIVHLVSRHETLPTVRDVCHLWNLSFSRPQAVYYYDGLEQVPAGLERRTNTWLEFTAVNAEISAHPWRFETAALDRLRENGLDMRDATIESIAVCQERFIAQSSRLQALAATIDRPRGAAPRILTPT
jgi:nucleoside-diphosphate-sugar epimerase